MSFAFATNNYCFFFDSFQMLDNSLRALNLSLALAFFFFFCHFLFRSVRLFVLTTSWFLENLHSRAIQRLDGECTAYKARPRSILVVERIVRLAFY